MLLTLLWSCVCVLFRVSFMWGISTFPGYSLVFHFFLHMFVQKIGGRLILGFLAVHVPLLTFFLRFYFYLSYQNLRQLLLCLESMLVCVWLWMFVSVFFKDSSWGEWLDHFYTISPLILLQLLLSHNFLPLNFVSLMLMTFQTLSFYPSVATADPAAAADVPAAALYC